MCALADFFLSRRALKVGYVVALNVVLLITTITPVSANGAASLDNYFHFQSLGSGLCLTAVDYYTVTQAECHGSNQYSPSQMRPELWQLIPLGDTPLSNPSHGIDEYTWYLRDGLYAIVSASTNTCLSVAGSNSESGVPIHLAACDLNQPTQQWKFVLGSYEDM